jgi:hypothetical protein
MNGEVMKKRRRTELYNVYLSKDERELLSRAAGVAFSPDSSSAGSASDVVRDSFTRFSTDYLGVESGELSLEEAALNYKKLLEDYLALNKGKK